MYAECQQLLHLFGLPYLIAPSEAEAQAAWLDSVGLVDGVVTDDNDAFLFGARRLYRNIFEGNKYVEEYQSEDIERELGLTRERLVELALLLGSDYTPGAAGVGVVNAVEIVSAFDGEGGGGLEKFASWMKDVDDEIVALAKFASGGGGGASSPDVVQEDTEKERTFKFKHRNVRKTWNLPSGFPSQEVVAAYLDPKIDSSKEKFTFARPDVDLLRQFCAQRFGWESARTDELLMPAIKAHDERQTQQTLDNFVAHRERFAKIKSKRLRTAVAGITGRVNEKLGVEEEDLEGQPAAKKTKMTPPKKKKATTTTTTTTTVTPQKRKKKGAVGEEEGGEHVEDVVGVMQGDNEMSPGNAVRGRGGRGRGGGSISNRGMRRGGRGGRGAGRGEAPRWRVVVVEEEEEEQEMMEQQPLSPNNE